MAREGYMDDTGYNPPEYDYDYDQTAFWLYEVLMSQYLDSKLDIIKISPSDLRKEIFGEV